MEDLPSQAEPDYIRNQVAEHRLDGIRSVCRPAGSYRERSSGSHLLRGFVHPQVGIGFRAGTKQRTMIKVLLAWIMVFAATVAQAASCDPLLYGMRCYNGRTAAVAGTAPASPDADDPQPRPGRVSRRKSTPPPQMSGIRRPRGGMLLRMDGVKQARRISSGHACLIFDAIDEG